MISTCINWQALLSFVMTVHSRLAFAVVCLVLLVGGSSHAQFYYPDQKIYSRPADYGGLRIQELTFPSEDGTKLHGWLIMAKGRRPLGTIVHFHGNAQNLTSHAMGVSWLAEAGYHVFLFDYRGYGKSEGNPTRVGIQADCRAAFEEVKKRLPREKRFYLFGQSLGAANVMNLAADINDPRVRAVIAEAGFDSYRRIAGEKLREAGMSWMPNLISTALNPIDAVKHIRAPLLIIHGTEDRVVPFAHGQRLYEAATDPKTLWRVERTGHLQTFQHAAYRQRFIQWLGRMGRN